MKTCPKCNAIMPTNADICRICSEVITPFAMEKIQKIEDNIRKQIKDKNDELSYALSEIKKEKLELEKKLTDTENEKKNLKKQLEDGQKKNNKYIKGDNMKDENYLPVILIVILLAIIVFLGFSILLK